VEQYLYDRVIGACVALVRMTKPQAGWTVVSYIGCPIDAPIKVFGDFCKSDILSQARI
jgi:hypothetical protein